MPKTWSPARSTPRPHRQGVLQDALQLALRVFPARLSATARRSRHRGHRHPRPDPPPAYARSHARHGFHLHHRSRRTRHAGEVPAFDGRPEPRHPRDARYAVEVDRQRRRPRRTQRRRLLQLAGRRPAPRRLRLRHQVEHPAPSDRAGLRRAGRSAVLHRRTRSRPAALRPCSCPTAPATPRPSPTKS